MFFGLRRAVNVAIWLLDSDVEEEIRVNLSKCGPKVC